MAAGGPGGFDFNQWQALNNNNSGGGAASGEAMTLDSLSKKSIDKAVSTVAKFVGVNPDIEGRGVIPSETNVSGGMSLSNASVVKDLKGGVLATILNYFTRELPKMWSGDEGGSASGGDYSGGGGGGDYSGGGGGDYSGGGSGSGSGSGSGYTGGDMHSFSSGSNYDMPDVRGVSYGDKIIATADVPVSEVGNLRPQATPTSGRDLDYGMSV